MKFRTPSVEPSLFRNEREKKDVRRGSLNVKKNGQKRKCILGVCAAKKKTTSDAMAQILDRLRAYGEFEIVVWGEEITQDESIPISKWPICDCLIAFSSSGFPLDRVKEYVRLRKPYCINDVFTQDIFDDRMMTYELLERYGIPTFRHIYADRRGGKKVHVKETADYIELDGKRMEKPFVEKPFEGNDHNIYIYYSKAQGGGCRKLFRKVKNKSSEYFAHVDSIRQDGNYCYEQFIEGVKDLKVYTIGPNYAHGEVRKSPAVDGIVSRNPDGKEMRLLTILTSEERDIARRIVKIFKQNICGFDVIRTNGRAYVIDVNGWSFVKGNFRYYDKCARTIRKMCLGSMTNLYIPTPMSLERKRTFEDGDNHHVLLSLVTVFRHGDRTPKRKLKLIMTQAEILWMFKNTKSEIKLKKRKQLLPFLEALKRLIARLEKSAPRAKDRELLGHIRFVRTVIEEDRKGLKIQLKPKKIVQGKVVECLLACKWGGTLTHMGLEQAKFYAPVFWSEMLRPPKTTGETLRQQAANYTKYKIERNEFLNGIQVYAANEPRVKSSAKAFIRETCEKEDIPPNTLHSDKKVQSFLDDVSAAKDHVEIAKKHVRKFITADEILVRSDPRFMPDAQEDNAKKETDEVKNEGTQVLSRQSSSKSDAKSPVKAKKGLHAMVTDSLRKAIAQLKEQDSRRRKKKEKTPGKLAFERQRYLVDEEEKSHDLTEWELRCLRWLKVPRSALKLLYNRLVNLNKQILEHVIESRKKRTPMRTPVLAPMDSTGRIPNLSLSRPAKATSNSKDEKEKTERLERSASVPLTHGKNGPEDKNQAPKLFSHNVSSPPVLGGLQTQTVERGDAGLFSEGYEDFDREETLRLYEDETIEELQGRWMALVEDFYDSKSDRFNTTKIPDIYDNIKYDSLHNRDILTGLRPIYIMAKNVASFVVPQEYGVFQTEKLRIGRAIVQPLLQHILQNLLRGMNENPSHRATLYFSSESHLHSLRNAILLSTVPNNKTVATTLEAMEINYMAHCVFRLFLDPTRDQNDPLRYYIDVQFAPGAALDPFIFMGQDHLLPVSRPIPVNGRVPLEDFKKFVEGK